MVPQRGVASPVVLRSASARWTTLANTSSPEFNRVNCLKT